MDATRSLQERVSDFRSQGCDTREIAKILGISRGAVLRALSIGDTTQERRSNCGRKKIADQFTAEELEDLKKRRLLGQGVAGAVQYWTRNPATLCPQWFRDFIAEKGCNKHSIPPSIRQALYVGPDLLAAHQGPKKFADQFSCGRLDDEAVGEAGDWFLFDDMSINHPFYFELGPRLDPTPEEMREWSAGDRHRRWRVTRNGTSDRLAERQGIMVGRQGLFACDGRSGKWLDGMHIGTAKDAYTAADILCFMRQVFERYGFPRKGIILERGSWASLVIDGLVSGEEVIAGLSSLGFVVKHAYSSRGKAFLEAAFRQLQDNQAMDNQALCIGRTRGQMEAAARKMRAVQTGARTPGEVGIWHIRQAAANTAAMMELMDTIPRAGEHQRGIPKDVWEASIAANPLRMPTKDDLAVFLPELLETEIRGMHVEKKKDGERYRWTAPALFGSLGNDYRVAIRFDSERPDEGCALYNLEPVNSSRNAQGLKPGEFMGWALPGDCGARQGLMKTARKAFRTRHAVTLGAARKIEGAEAKPGEAASLRTANSVPRSPIPISRETPAPSAERMAELKQFEDEFDQALA